MISIRSPTDVHHVGKNDEVRQTTVTVTAIDDDDVEKPASGPSFHFFPLLPAELRLEIWAHALSHPAVVSVSANSSPDTTTSTPDLTLTHHHQPSTVHPSPPAVALSCAEAHVEHRARFPPPLHLNPQRTIFFAPSPSALAALLKTRHPLRHVAFACDGEMALRETCEALVAAPAPVVAGLQSIVAVVPSTPPRVARQGGGWVVRRGTAMGDDGGGVEMDLQDGVLDDAEVLRRLEGCVEGTEAGDGSVDLWGYQSLLGLVDAADETTAAERHGVGQRLRIRFLVQRGT